MTSMDGRRLAPFPVRQSGEGEWEVQFVKENGEPDGLQRCDNEEDARTLGVVPVLVSDCYEGLRSDPGFAAELMRTAAVLKRYRPCYAVAMMERRATQVLGGPRSSGW